MCVFPKYRKLELIPQNLRHFERDGSCMAYDLSCLVEESTTDRGWVRHQRDHLCANVFLESLEEEESDQYGEVVGHVGAEAQERKLLAGEVLQFSMDQFIRSPLVVEAEDFGRLQSILMPGLAQQIVDVLPLPEVGIDHGVRPSERQEPLAIFIEWLRENRPSRLAPGPPLILEFEEAPLLGFAIEDLPVLFRELLSPVTNRLVQLAAADVSNVHLFASDEDGFVEETTIHTHHNRHLGSEMCADGGHGLANHLDGVVAVVAVSIASAKDCIDDETLPGQLEGMESLDLLVSGLNPMTLVGVIVVQDHRVEAQDDDLGFGKAQPPQEELTQQLSEEVNYRQREGFEEPLDGMGGQEVLLAAFHDTCVSRILLQGIKVLEMPAGSIDQKNEDLFEDLEDGQALTTLSQASEELLQDRPDANVVEVSHEEVEPCSSGQGIVGHFDFGDGVRVLEARGRMHLDLPPVGLRRVTSPITANCLTVSSLPRQVGDLCYLNRSA